jgi:hypothetical protein
LNQKVLKYTKIIILCSCFYFLFVALFSNDIADNDLWGYLSFGRAFWEDGKFLFHDIFSYTPTKTLWVYHEWLTSILFYSIIKYSGPAGLQLFRYIIIIVTVYLVYLTAIKKGSTIIATLIILVPAMLLISFGYVPVRAQIFTYLFFILTVYILEIARKDGLYSVLWWLLPIQLLWCNFHGGFVAGLGLIILYAIGEALEKRRIKPFVKIFILSSLVTLINPYGYKYWVYTLSAVLMPRPEINEWKSVITALTNNIHQVPVIIFVVWAILLLLFILFRKKRDITDLLVIAVVAYLGFKSIRHGILFGLVFGACFPVVISEYWLNWKTKKIFFTRWSGTPQVCLAAVFILIYLFINPTIKLNAVPTYSILVPSSRYPTGAVDWIKKNNISGNILPHFDWGEYLIWTCYPSCRVAMDGRYETVYEEYVYKDYFDFLMGREGWQTFLNKYPHNIVLIKRYSKTHSLMLKELLWEEKYSDQTSILFMRKKFRSYN